MITKKIAQALTLLFQLYHAEVLPTLQDALRTGRLNQAIRIVRVFQVSDGIQEIRLRHVDDIVYLRFLGILLRNFLIRYGTIEITIIMKQIGRYFGTGFPVDR